MGPFIGELGERFQAGQPDSEILEWIIGRTPVREWLCLVENEDALTDLRVSLALPRPGRAREKRIDVIGGLKVELFANEHPPPHFRVSYGGDSANYRIRDCKQLNGGLHRYQRAIRDWHSENKPKLIATWNAFRPADCPVGQYMEV